MADTSIYVASASIYSPLFRHVKNFPDFQFRNNLRKMLTLNMYETASRRPLSATDSMQR